MKTTCGSNVSVRAVGLGLILLPVNIYWMSIAELKYDSQATALPLFIYPVFLLFLLALLNLVLRRFTPRFMLHPGELLTVYVMLVISTSVAAYGMMQDLFAVIVHPYQFATPENDWSSLFFRYIPPWFTIHDRHALATYYAGDSSFYLREHLLAWWKPILIWSGFTFTLLLAMQCLNTLFRRQWVQQERLSFPIVQLPVAMSHSGAFFGQPLLWVGFGIVAVLDLLSGLHVLYPAVPALNLKLYSISQYFTERPWNAMGTTRTSLYPFMIGIGFFLPLDLSFSCWFFFLFRQIFRVLTSYVGFQSMPSFPYFHEQAAGAWIGFALMALWLTRRHLLDTLRIAWRGGEDAEEPMRYRTAFIGLLLSILGLTLFCRQAGMSLGVTWTFFGLYFLIAIAITRLRAEFGAPHGIFNHPLEIMVTTFGTARIGPQNLTTMSFFFWFNRGYRPHPMPNQLEAFRMAETTRMSARRLSVALLLAGAVSILLTFWIDLSLIYREGATSRLGSFRLWVGSGAFKRLQRWLYYPQKTDWIRVAFMGIGTGLVFLLRFLRMRFLFWPFHPAGYPLAVSFAIDYFWFPFFLSWLCKSIILRFGRIRGYQRAIPFFLGLILGDFVVGGLWMLFGVLADRQTYMFFI